MYWPTYLICLSTRINANMCQLTSWPWDSKLVTHGLNFAVPVAHTIANFVLGQAFIKEYMFQKHLISTVQKQQPNNSSWILHLLSWKLFLLRYKEQVKKYMNHLHYPSHQQFPINLRIGQLLCQGEYVSKTRRFIPCNQLHQLGYQSINWTNGRPGQTVLHWTERRQTWKTQMGNIFAIRSHKSIMTRTHLVRCHCITLTTTRVWRYASRGWTLKGTGFAHW